MAPKRRRKALCGNVRRKSGEVPRELCGRKGVEALEGRAGPERVHARLSAPPKRGAAAAAGRMKGKSAIRIYRELCGGKGGRIGIFGPVDSMRVAGLDEKRAREYIKSQECLGNGRQGALNLGGAKF
ncbi:MAG: transposase [Treponema sp.]|nr:transposase [Treponema sp.]